VTSAALVVGAPAPVVTAVVQRLAADGRPVAVLGAPVQGAALSLPVHLPAADAVAVAERELGPVGALVCGVPLPEPVPFLGRDPSEWFAETTAALTPTFALVRAAAPSLRRAGAGRLVLLGAGWTPAARGGTTAASAASGAVVALVKTLARDLGPDGVTVNEVVTDVRERPSPAAVARAVSYLCSSAAGAVVGQLLTVGTGGSLRP
jgi:NAD(P)-dependent dehydrogenase (short-subunit alcohol dehydrogenase family)